MLERLPKPVLERIREQVRRSANNAHIGWESGNDEEDTLTGDLGATLRNDVVGVRADVGDEWSWRVTYKKLRGRGPGADEKPLGADGIFEIRLKDERSKIEYRKGLLYQSMKIDSKNAQKLREQVRKMEAIVPNGCAVFEYGPDQYSAWAGTEHRDIRTAPRKQLGDFLSDRFMTCEVGKLGVYYDGVRRALVVPDETEGVILAKATLKERIRVEVTVES